MPKTTKPTVRIRGNKVTVTFDLSAWKLPRETDDKPKWKTPLGRFANAQEAADAHDVTAQTILNRVSRGVKGYGRLGQKKVATAQVRRPAEALR